MSKFIPTTKRNGACEVCGDESGKCRRLQHGEIHLCMTYGDARIGQLENGYKCIANKSRGWATFKLDNTQNWTDQQRSNWQARNAHRRQQQQAEAKARKRRSLDAVERDRQYRQLLAELTLHRDDLASLIRRGFTHQEIDLCGFKSVEQYQQLQATYSELLPGIGVNGHSLVNYNAGYLCPVRNKDGLIVACQVRLRVLPEGEKNRYRWLASGKRGHILHFFPESGNPEGELPLAVQRPMGEPKGIALAEGIGAKPFLVSQRLNLLVIGAAGGQWASSPGTFRETLDSLSAELSGLKIIHLYPDAGDVQNPQVMHRLKRVIALLTKWGWTVQVGWWGQVDKTHPDIDELASFDALAYLTPEEFLALGERFDPTAHSFSGLFGWLPRLKKQLEKLRISPWGFGRQGEVEVEPTAPKTLPAIEYQPGERLSVWPTATKDCKNILDTSGTGSGKSFDAGLATPELFGSARQVIYLSTEHRNPTTPTLQGWPDLEARHNGLYRDKFGKLRRVDEKEQPYVVPPNCGRNNTISALRSKNIEAADTAQLICQTCPYLEPCRGGAVFGYLNNRMESLKESRLRAHPLSLPSPDEYDYSEVVLLWEEATELVKAHRFIEVRAADWQQVFADLAGKLPAAFHALIPLLTILYQYLSGSIPQPNKYGWGDALLRAALLVPTDLDVAAITAVLNADLSFLNTTAKYGVDLADLPRQQRKHFSDSDTVTAELVAQRVALNWLPDFLNVLLGNVVGGNLRIQSGVLTITLPDTRLAEIAQKAAGNIFLDATATAKDLALVLGVNPESILTVRQAAPETSNLEIIQVATLGRLGVGNKRSEFCQQRVDALINQIQQDTPGKTAVIDFKRYSQTGNELRRSWWVDSRGVNDLEDASALVLVGVPCRNLGALAAEFTVLHGKSPLEGTERVKYPIQVNGTPSPELQPWFEMEVSADPEFREFCRRRILADIHQAIGRLRAHRRNSEPLRVYFIGDYPLDIPVTLQRASDITKDAATKVERVEMAIRAAVSQLQATGQKITQSALATIVGVTQGYISRFRELLQTLLNDSNSTRNNSSAPPPDPMEVEWMGREYLPKLTQEAEPELLLGVLTTFEAYGLTGWQQIWSASPAATQIKILTALMFTLNAGEWRTLCTSVGVTP